MRISRKKLRRIIREVMGEERPAAYDEELFQAIVDIVRDVVGSGGGLFDLEAEFRDEMFTGVSTHTEPIPMVTLYDDAGTHYAVLNKNNALDAEATVGPFAIGVLE